MREKSPEYSAFIRQVGLNIRKYRQAKGLSQKEIASKSGLAVITYGSIERGQIGTKIRTLYDIAKNLDISPAELLLDDSVICLNRNKIKKLLDPEE